MFLKLLILSLIIVIFAAIGFGIRILIKTGGRFPDTHISNNDEMKRRGITCARHNDVGCKPADNYTGCASCESKI